MHMLRMNETILFIIITDRLCGLAVLYFVALYTHTARTPLTPRVRHCHLRQQQQQPPHVADCAQNTMESITVSSSCTTLELTRRSACLQMLGVHFTTLLTSSLSARGTSHKERQSIHKEPIDNAREKQREKKTRM